MPDIELRIPETLRHHSGCFAGLIVSAETIPEALDCLAFRQPNLYQSICDETGAVRKHIHVFINHDFIDLKANPTPNRLLKDGDVMTIWTAVSGG